MSWWLVFERCNGCQDEQCAVCKQDRAQLVLRLVQAQLRPLQTITGPFDTTDDFSSAFGHTFGFDQTGRVYFKHLRESVG